MAKILKDLHPNKDYAELLRDVASRVETLQEPIDDKMIEQIKILSENVIEQGRKEKEEFEINKQNFFKTAMNEAMKKHEKENKLVAMVRGNNTNPKPKRVKNAAIWAARGIRKRKAKERSVSEED